VNFEDINAFEDGFAPRSCLYWIGSRSAVAKGHYSDLRPVYVLAKGAYTTYVGECGPAVKVVPGGRVRKLVVATWHDKGWRWGSYRNRYDEKRWEVDVIQAQQVLMEDVEYRTKVRAQREDAARHAKAKQAVQEERKKLGLEVAKAVGLNGLSSQAEVSVSTYWDTVGNKRVQRQKVYITLKVPIGTMERHLPKKGKEALKALASIKDPAC
jgi:hypothetical protein